MLKNLNSTKKALLLGTILATGFASHAAFADPINATDSLGYFNVAVAGNGGDLIGATAISSTSMTGNTQAAGTGDLSAFGAGTSITALNTLFTGGVNGGNGGSEAAFSFTVAGAGVFTETANPLLQSSSTAAGGVEAETYYLLGTFVPTGTLAGAGFTAGPASFDVSFTETPSQSGGGISYSGSGTFASPPTPPPGVPEPASMALLGAGLAGLGLVRRRRKS